MFVLPPPPRYPTQAAYNAAIAGGHIAPMIETNNILTNPTGSDCEFLVGEGLYVLKENLHLATPPPHPSEAPVANPNPLSTSPQPASVGTKTSLLNLDLRATPPAAFKSLSSLGGSIPEHPYHEKSETSTDGSRGPSTDASASLRQLGAAPPAFGEGNSLLAAVPLKDASKKRKPKNNVTKSNSSFISRAIVHETLAKKLQERPTDGLFAFANVNRAFQWLDMSSDKKNDYLTKILFTKAHCLCHDVNQITKSTNHIDVIMGFSTGEIIWWEPISQRYTRLNKNGIINGTPVSEIRWIPGSENLFLAAHMDGSLVVYDKEKEDAIFSKEDEEGGAVQEDGENASGGGDAANGTTTNGDKPATKMEVQKSVHSKNQKSNPVSFWKLSNQRINAFAFSPDNRHLAVASEDGSLRILDYLKEELLDLYYAYYGGLICVCWSPDGKYVLTGGQDDLISIWSVVDACLMARCQGHHSWVTSVAFDPWRCDDKNYRFGSVGEDCRLCLWDFNVGMLHRPKAAMQGASVHQRPSLASRLTPQETSTSRLRSNSNLSNGFEDDSKFHAVEPRSRTATLPPVSSKIVGKDPVTWLGFTEDSIITSSKTGHIRTWLRPSESIAQNGASS